MKRFQAILRAGVNEVTTGPTTLLTGLPRSGTTLICALLNEAPDTLALAEPLLLNHDGDRERALGAIDAFVADIRMRALTTGEVVTKHVGGIIPDNWVEPPTATPRLRKVLEVRSPIQVGKPLSAGFHLFIKHPAEFSALADRLVDRYRLVAVVRHPLAVLASWQTVDMPVGRGHMPMAEVFARDLAELLGSEPDCIRRQVALIGWLLSRYARFAADNILRYEDLMAAPARELSRLTPHVRGLTRSLSAYDPATRYPGIDFPRLARELMAICPIAEQFYPDFAASLAPWLAEG